ncbi:MAG: phosphatase PAP2 family protein [Candidatus Gottesmanbacteria bacterium]
MNIGSIDTSVFYAINHLPHGWFVDGFFGLVSGLGDSGFIWFVIGIWLIAKEELKDKRFFLPLGLAGFFSWFFSECIIKSFIARLRPSTILDDAVVIGFPNGYSFPSTHTTLAFALAFVLSYKEPKYTKWFYLLAILIGFSRIYVGHHYPGDVLAGMVLGLCIGVFTIVWYRNYAMKKGKKKLYNK